MVLTRLARLRWMVLLLCMALLGVAGSASARSGDAATAGHRNHLGELHAAWWQWAFSFPFSEHPLTPGSGATCGSGQTGHVWFLGGVFNMTGTETRDCAIPSGTALAVAVADVECSTVESAPFSATDPASLRACAAGVADPASLLFVGRTFAVLDDHSLSVRRAPSPVFR